VHTSLGITGKEAELVLDEVGITLNKNMIADDPRSPLDPSGIRFGTPAMTTRGMKEKEAKALAELMIETMKNKDDEVKKKEIKSKVQKICQEFPVPEKFN
jgi:glycine hydroxymethyltransferase